MAEKRFNDNNVVVRISDVLQKALFIFVQAVVNKKGDVGGVGDFENIAGVFIDYRLFVNMTENVLGRRAGLQQNVLRNGFFDVIQAGLGRITKIKRDDFQARGQQSGVDVAVQRIYFVQDNTGYIAEIFRCRGADNIIGTVSFSLKFEQKAGVLGFGRVGAGIIITGKVVFPQAFV